MTSHDLPPPRLLDTHATPPALRDALQALRERAPSAEVATRLEQRLGQPARPVRTASRVARPLLAIGLLALFGALGVWAWPEHQAIRPPRSASPPQAPARPLPAAPKAQLEYAAPAEHAPAPTRVEIAVATAPVPPVEVTPEAAPVPTPATRPALATKRAKAPAPAPVRQPALSIQPIVEDQAPAATTPTQAEAPARKLTAPSEDAERVFADPQDEAGLLYRARRLSSSDPSAALRLLVLHEASFPDGAFVQERDMLEIQIHERLGHAATAKRLAAMFKQRYPASVYRVGP